MHYGQKRLTIRSRIFWINTLNRTKRKKIYEQYFSAIFNYEDILFQCENISVKLFFHLIEPVDPKIWNEDLERNEAIY